MSKTTPTLSTVDTLALTSEIVAAFVSNNALKAEKLPALLQETHDAVRALASGGAAYEASKAPAVPISKSISSEHIICLEDGKKLKMLKRYLRTRYDLSPEEYRRKWGLPADYPMVAPSYAKRRSQFARQIGLGRTSGASPAPAGKTTSRRGPGRPKKVKRAAKRVS